MGIHNLAPVFSSLRLGPPKSVHASSTAVYEETLPLASTVHYEFPARGNLPPVTLHWYDGGLIAARPPELEDGPVETPLDLTGLGEVPVLEPGELYSDLTGRDASEDGRPFQFKKMALAELRRYDGLDALALEPELDR